MNTKNILGKIDKSNFKKFWSNSKSGLKFPFEIKKNKFNKTNFGLFHTTTYLKNDESKSKKTPGERLREIADSMKGVGTSLNKASQLFSETGKLFSEDVKNNFSNAGNNFDELIKVLDELNKNVIDTQETLSGLSSNVTDLNDDIDIIAQYHEDLADKVRETAKLIENLSNEGIYNISQQLIDLTDGLSDLANKVRTEGTGIETLRTNLNNLSDNLSKINIRVEKEEGKVANLEKSLDRVSKRARYLGFAVVVLAVCLLYEYVKEQELQGNVLKDEEKMRKLEERVLKIEKHAGLIEKDVTTATQKLSIDTLVKRIEEMDKKLAEQEKFDPVTWKEKLVKRISLEEQRLQAKLNNSTFSGYFGGFFSWGYAHKQKILALEKLKNEINSLDEKEWRSKLSPEVIQQLKEAYKTKENEDKIFEENFLKARIFPDEKKIQEKSPGEENKLKMR